MTDDVFRFYVNTRDTCFITENALRDCQQETQSNSTELIPDVAIVTFILGGLVVNYLKH